MEGAILKKDTAIDRVCAVKLEQSNQFLWRMFLCVCLRDCIEMCATV
jgi:hypothetical protein